MQTAMMMPSQSPPDSTGWALTCTTLVTMWVITDGDGLGASDGPALTAAAGTGLEPRMAATAATPRAIAPMAPPQPPPVRITGPPLERDGSTNARNAQSRPAPSSRSGGACMVVSPSVGPGVSVDARSYFGDADRDPVAVGLEHPAAAEVKGDVAGGRVDGRAGVEDQVARLELAFRDVREVGPLLLAGPG